MSGRSELSPLFSWRGAIMSAESNLSTTTKCVAMALSLHMNEKGGSCFPSIETLAEETSMSYDGTRRHLRKLRLAGWLTCTTERRGVAGGTRVFYSATIGIENTGIENTGIENTGIENTGIESPGVPNTEKRIPGSRAREYRDRERVNTGTEGPGQEDVSEDVNEDVSKTLSQPVVKPKRARPPSAGSDEPVETTSPSLRNPAAKKPRKRREPKPSSNGTLAEKFPALFAEFWSAYPRKIGKPPATAAFQKALMRTGTAAPIMAGLARHAARWAEIDEAQFVPHPATWLNRDGWDDDLAPLPKRKQSRLREDLEMIREMFEPPAAPRQRAANGSNGSEALTTTAREIPAATGRSRGQSAQLPEGLTTL